MTLRSDDVRSRDLLACWRELATRSYRSLDFDAVRRLADLLPLLGEHGHVGISNPTGYFNAAYNGVLYDPVGRSFRAGVRFKL